MKRMSTLCTRVLLGASTQQHIQTYSVVCCSAFWVVLHAFHVQYMYTAIHIVRVWLPSVIPTSAQGAGFRFGKVRDR